MFNKVMMLRTVDDGLRTGTIVGGSSYSPLLVLRDGVVIYTATTELTCQLAPGDILLFDNLSSAEEMIIVEMSGIEVDTTSDARSVIVFSIEDGFYLEVGTMWG